MSGLGLVGGGERNKKKKKGGSIIGKKERKKNEGIRKMEECKKRGHEKQE